MTEITKKAIEAAEREFTEYFVRNYPGPDTIIFDPKWHAPKLFRAATHSLTSSPGKDGGQEVEKLRDAYKKGFEASAEGFNAEYHPAFETDNEWLADCELAVQAIHASPAYSTYSPSPQSTVDADAVIERLTKALEPFAQEAKRYDPDEGDGDDTVWSTPAYFKIRDLREARSALSASQSTSREEGSDA